jgi:hypothetical protein
MTPLQATTLAPENITMTTATLKGIIYNQEHYQIQACLWWRRSGRRYWNCGGCFYTSSSPYIISAPITATQPQYQHEYYVDAMRTDIYPPPIVQSEIRRFWFIPGSPRGKGAPFLTTSAQFSQNNLQISLTATTDIACHLWARISTVRPFSLQEVETKKGRRLKHHPTLIWQYQWEIPQQESGDTTTHTFSWTAPRYCIIYYWQLWGKTDGKTSPSRSPFLEYHPIAPTEPIPTSDQAPVFGYYTSTMYWGNACMQTIRPDHDYKLRRIRWGNFRVGTNRYGDIRIILAQPGPTCWQPNILWETTIDSRICPLPGTAQYTDIDTPDIQLYKDYTYWLIIMCVPPWYILSQGQWVRSDGSMYHYTWHTANPNIYTRGAMYTGCNFRDQKGYWANQNTDLTFIFCEKP